MITRANWSIGLMLTINILLNLLNIFLFILFGVFFDVISLNLDIGYSCLTLIITTIDDSNFLFINNNNDLMLANFASNYFTMSDLNMSELNPSNIGSDSPSFVGSDASAGGGSDPEGSGSERSNGSLSSDIFRIPENELFRIFEQDSLSNFYELINLQANNLIKDYSDLRVNETDDIIYFFRELYKDLFDIFDANIRGEPLIERNTSYANISNLDPQHTNYLLKEVTIKYSVLTLLDDHYIDRGFAEGEARHAEVKSLFSNLSLTNSTDICITNNNPERIASNIKINELYTSLLGLASSSLDTDRDIIFNHSLAKNGSNFNFTNLSELKTFLAEVRAINQSMILQEVANLQNLSHHDNKLADSSILRQVKQLDNTPLVVNSSNVIQDDHDANIDNLAKQNLSNSSEQDNLKRKRDLSDNESSVIKKPRLND